MIFGTDKSQAYLRYKLSDSVTVNFGQFDTLYGVELNDSKDRIFSKTGIIFDNFLPSTHTGLVLEKTWNGFTGKVMAANPSNKGTQGTVASGDYRTEYGATLGYANENYRLQLGYLTRPMKKLDGLTWSQRDYVNVTAGVTFGNLSFDAEYDQLTDPTKNTLTTGDSTDVEKASTGYMGLLSYKFGENWLVGLRYEALKDDPLKASIESADSEGLAIHYKLSTDVELRQEFINYNYKNLAGDKWSNTRILFGAIWGF